jgi:hypothetical protein
MPTASVSSPLRALARRSARVHALGHLVNVRWVEPSKRHLNPAGYKETYVNEALRSRVAPTTYLEIGVRDGVSLRYARAQRKIAIDPERLQTMTSLRRDEEFYQVTSDDFFQNLAPSTLSPKTIDVAMIDGLHEFEQVLRDVNNLEPYMKDNGVIILDDCNPPSPSGAAPVRDHGGPWNGDVWKIAPYLIQERSDLAFMTLDADEGVGVISGFGHANAPGSASHPVSHYKALDYEYLRSDRKRVLNLVDPKDFGSMLQSMGEGRPD